MPTINVVTDLAGFNKRYRDYLDNESRYLVLYGGAGSGKSYFIAQRYVDKMLHIPTNLLVIRNTAKSNRDSTFALLKQVINKNNDLQAYFKVNKADMRITTTLSNSEVIFAGLDDVEKLKSITFSNGELTDIWIEEASEISEADFNQLDIRLRGKGAKKQIVLSFNPIDVNHWLKKRFVDIKQDNVTVLKTTYKDNAHLDKDYIKLLESYKKTDPYYYNVYCLGNWGVLGATVFDAQKISDRIAQLKKPLKTGYFRYDYDGTTISNIEWVDDVNGFIDIYELPKKKVAYGIGGDTAGDGSDYYTALVGNAYTGHNIAKLRHQTDSDLYTKQMYCLGNYYNNALMGIEVNFDSFPVKELTRLGYKNMYIREQQDTYTGKYKKAFGFRTDAFTRPAILNRLIELVRDHIDFFYDRDLLEEMLTFVRNEKGRMEAKNGAHDDLVMGCAILYETLTQVPPKPIEVVEKKVSKYDADEHDEDYESEDEEDSFLNYEG